MSAATGCIVLAAGAARRMGQLKQLLPYRGSTLLANAITQAQGALLQPVVVVLGAESERVRESIRNCDIYVSENANWDAGMGSSIVCGLRALLNTAPDVQAVAIVLADQPLITAEHLRAMAAEAELSEADVVAASFDGTLGPPAFFRASTFPALLELKREAGAKRLFSEAGWTTRPFVLDEAAADIDTPQDFERLSVV